MGAAASVPSSRHPDCPAVSTTSVSRPGRVSSHDEEGRIQNYLEAPNRIPDRDPAADGTSAVPAADGHTSSGSGSTTARALDDSRKAKELPFEILSLTLTTLAGDPLVYVRDYVQSYPPAACGTAVSTTSFLDRNKDLLPAPVPKLQLLLLDGPADCDPQDVTVDRTADSLLDELIRCVQVVCTGDSPGAAAGLPISHIELRIAVFVRQDWWRLEWLGKSESSLPVDCLRIQLAQPNLAEAGDEPEILFHSWFRFMDVWCFALWASGSSPSWSQYQALRTAPRPQWTGENRKERKRPPLFGVNMHPHQSWHAIRTGKKTGDTSALSLAREISGDFAKVASRCVREFILECQQEQQDIVKKRTRSGESRGRQVYIQCM